MFYYCHNILTIRRIGLHDLTILSLQSAELMLYYCHNILRIRWTGLCLPQNIVSSSAEPMFYYCYNILTIRWIGLCLPYNIVYTSAELIMQDLHNILSISGGPNLFSTIYIRATSKYTRQYISAGIQGTHVLKVIVLFQVANSIRHF